MLILPLVRAHDSQANFDFSDGSDFFHNGPVPDEIRPVFIKRARRKIVPLFMVETRRSTAQAERDFRREFVKLLTAKLIRFRSRLFKQNTSIILHFIAGVAYGWR
jgi:hypothetical protein